MHALQRHARERVTRLRVHPAGPAVGRSATARQSSTGRPPPSSERIVSAAYPAAVVQRPSSSGPDPVGQRLGVDTEQLGHLLAAQEAVRDRRHKVVLTSRPAADEETKPPRRPGRGRPETDDTVGKWRHLHCTIAAPARRDKVPGAGILGTGDGVTARSVDSPLGGPPPLRDPVAAIPGAWGAGGGDSRWAGSAPQAGPAGSAPREEGRGATGRDVNRGGPTVAARPHCHRRAPADEPSNPVPGCVSLQCRFLQRPTAPAQEQGPPGRATCQRARRWYSL